MSDSLFVVLNDAHTVESEHSFLVAPVKNSDRPRLVTSGNNPPLKGQVIDLKVTDSNAIDFSVVEFDKEETRLIQEHYTNLNPSLVVKNDWSVAALQEFFPLESLVPLDSDTQLMLYNTMRNRPEELLLVGFADLPALNYADYTRLCARFNKSPLAACLGMPASRKLRELEALYAQGVPLRSSELADLTPSVVNILTERAGLDCTSDILSWQFTLAVEKQLSSKLGALEGMPGSTWCMQSHTNPFSEHIRSRSLSVLDCPNTVYTECLFQTYTVVDFADADDCETVVRRLHDVKFLLLINTHLASPSTLLAIFQQNTPINTLLLLDARYRTPTTNLLPVHGSIGERPIPLYSLEDKRYHDIKLYSQLTEFLDYYKSMWHESVLVVSTLEDMLSLECALDTTGKVMQVDDPLCTPLRVDFDWGETVTVSVMGRTTCSVLEGSAFPIPNTVNYYKDALARADVLRVGQLRQRYTSVFYYTQTPIDSEEFYRFSMHTCGSLVICAPDHVLNDI